MEISDIKSRLSIHSVIEHYGHKANRNQLIRCPFHADDKASLQLYPKTNTWYCFGCNKGTDQIDFIFYMESSRNPSGVSKHEAILKAKALLNYDPDPKPMMKPEPQRKAITAARRIEALTKAFHYFARSIHGSEQARHYLTQRNLDYKKITVGYDSRNFHKSKETSAELKELYLATGLIYPDKQGRANNYHSFFNGSIVFPICNEQGQVVNLYGRNIEDSKENRHRYLPGRHQGLYPCYPKEETETLILTESIIDCATLTQHQSMFKVPPSSLSFLACYGTNGFTAEHTEAIRQLSGLQEVIIFFDGDKSGKEGAAAIAAKLKTYQIPRITCINTPEGEDINSLLQGHDTEILTRLFSERTLFSSQDRGVFFSSEKESETDQPANDQPARTEIPKVASERTLSVDPSTLSSLNVDNPEQLLFENQHLSATLWGGIDLYNIKKLRATLHVQSKANRYLEYRDTIDLYSYSQTQRLIREAVEKLEISNSELSKGISELTSALEQYRQRERDKEKRQEEAEKRKNLESFTQGEMEQGAGLLKDPKLMSKTEGYIKTIGLVGEEEKGMLLFFILLTRMFKSPLHALVQGKSGSGKTYLLKKVASLVPKAHIRITTALTENTLYHSIKDYWKHQILLIEDLDGVFNALLPLREMMSNQSISKLSTEKNLKTGEFEQKILYVEGPVCVAGATTKDSIYEDNANRSFLIHVNESPAHQERVLDYQRKEIAGLMDKFKEQQTQTILKTAQLHLEPLEVVIPFGEELRLPDYVFKKLRTNAHYLTLIKAIAFWHQKQREVKHKQDGTRYIEANPEDVAWANTLSREVLLRKSDELNGALRGFFESLKTWLKENRTETFYAKPLRERFRMNPMQVNRYIRELDQRGYIKQLSGNRKSGFEYTVMVWDDYEMLQDGLNILDQTLEKLKANHHTK